MSKDDEENPSETYFINQDRANEVFVPELNEEVHIRSDGEGIDTALFPNRVERLLDHRRLHKGRLRFQVNDLKIRITVLSTCKAIISFHGLRRTEVGFRKGTIVFADEVTGRQRGGRDLERRDTIARRLLCVKKV